MKSCVWCLMCLSAADGSAAPSSGSTGHGEMTLQRHFIPRHILFRRTVKDCKHGLHIDLKPYGRLYRAKHKNNILAKSQQAVTTTYCIIIRKKYQRASDTKLEGIAGLR